MRRFIFVFFIILSHVVVAQESSLWTIPQNQAKVAQNSYLQARVGLNQPRLNEIVKEVSSKGSSQITIPLPDGEELPFTIMPTQLMAPELQRKHPEIKTFKGHNQNGDILRMDINSFGMHAMILSKSGKGTIYLDPASEFDADTDYISYYKKDYMNAHSYESPGCLNENMTAASLRKAVSKNRTEQNSTFFKFSVGENLRKYRMAVTAHPTFSSRTGNNNALATIVSVMNRITGIFENDMAITFEIVANNDELIYTNGNRGPFRNDDTLDQMRMKNQSNTDAVIGENNYEIGHIFGGSPFGGRAPAGSVCRSGLKAAGGSSSFFQNNRLDVFAVDLVAHEIGHQFGALHTFTSGRNCTLGADQFTQRDAYEMGSGSTIMSYIGLCGNNNIQDDVDDYYHTKSVQEMFKYLNSGQGGCAQLISTGNTPPTVTVAESGFSIPINTPFVLEADANDVNGDVLTYNWEQFDPATKMENMFGTPLGQFFTREELEAAGFTEIQIQAILLRQEQKLEAAFEGDGPLFRSFKAQRSNKRYFPRLSDVVADDTTRFEVLPFKTRDLNFVITVRDNNVSGGGVTNELLSFSSTMQAGPFLVTSQFTDAEYQGLTDVPLEWDVAGTDVAPVNCQLVDIFYSVDGGENFDILLKENTANDGSETITLPNFPTEKGRIMVKASDNVFFNVNKDDINVKSVDVEAPDAPTNLTASESTTAQVTLSWTDNSSTEDGFIIERQQGSGTFTSLDSVVLEQTSYIDESITVADTYNYRVVAYNATGTSGFSNTATVTIDETTPNAPTALSGNLSNINIVDLSWTDNSDVESGFIIERRTGDTGSFSEIDRTIPDQTTYTDNSIQTSGDYQYRVSAFNLIGTSAPTENVLIEGVNTEVAPAAPTDLTGTKPNDITVELSWTQNSTIEDGFIIERRETGTSEFVEIARTALRINDYIDSIGGAEEYFYRIKAFNENGESDYSNTLTVAGARPFITLWEIEAAETITISLIRPKSYDFEYKWLKDGTVVESGRFTQNNIKTENVTTTFDEAGSYQLEINGIFPGGGFSAEKMREIIQWGGIAWETLGFRGWQGNITATDAPNLSKVTSLSGIFREATNVNADLSNWDVSTITNMERAFQGATSFNGNISSWDVSNVTNMKEMFSGASTFNSDISSWNVERVVNMASTFKNATAFNGNINGWNVANVEDMSDLFFSAPAFNQDLNSWNVSAVTNMGGIFSRATNFNGNISNWNTSKVTNLGNAFSRTENFNGDISGWNTESVTSMGNTFDKANAFDQDLSGWNVASVTNMKNMFRDGVLSTLNYDKILNSWSQQDVRSDVELNVNSFYCESEQARQSLIDTKGWSIGDRGKKCEQPTDIVSFTFAEQGSNTSSINTANHTVTVEVEAGSDITSLVPDITVSNGATISPASGVAQNFTNPFTYTVTSQDGSITQAWVVTVSVETLNNETDFISFTIPERRSDAVINSSDHTISAEVLNGTDVTKLQPTFTLSDGATSTPVSGSEVDFTNPVNYSITAEDGTTTQTWVVTVTESQETSSNQTDILSFELVSQVSPTIIDFDNHTVEAFASNGTDLTALSPTIALSAGATSTPAMGTPVDFTNPVNYLVTAEDEITTQQWTVTVTEAEAPLNNETDILSFEVDNQVSAALINAGSSSIEVEVINGTDLTQLTPAFTLSDGATSSPGSGQQVDFTNPVNYIITAEDGTTTQSWTVTITEAQEPLSTETDIISFEVDNQVSAAVIDAENHSVEVEVINGTDLTELNPAITISEGATSSPASGTTVDFSSLVNYEITAEDGVTTQTWEVTVTEEPILTNITDALKWRVYPNPADQLLYIESNRTVTVYLVDLYGRKISEDHTGKNIELKMPDVAPGPYLLMISDNNKLDYQRIYKN